MTLYHGGPPGLREVLPPSTTGVRSAADFGAENVCRRDRVYLTSSVDAARMFAAMAPVRGPVWVYEVVASADLADDPDCATPGLSFEASAATVVRVVERISSSRRRRIQRQVLAA